MMYSIEISKESANDIDSTFKYYNNASYGLGYRFINMIDDYLEAIAALPTASAIRYNNVKVRPVDVFPFTIHYANNEKLRKEIVIRVFHTKLSLFRE